MKRQADTAIAVYRDTIQPTLKSRQALILQRLSAFTVAGRYGPTALELLRDIQLLYPHRRFDVNSVRPRLNELEHLGKVCHGVKRRCDVSGKVVYTWLPIMPVKLQQQALGFAGEATT